MRDALAAGLWTLALLGYAIADFAGAGGIGLASWALAAGALSITALNWYAHDGGRHPSFLFLGLGCLFLAGRAMPVLGGAPSMLDTVSFAQSFSVHRDTVSSYVLLVLMSFLLVHVGSLATRARSSQAIPSGSRFEARVYFALFVLLLPLYIYKNVYYLRYLMEHGGYLAIYLGSEHIEGVGAVARLGALLCLSAFTLYFFHEADRVRARRALVFFVLVFSVELLIGLRGKYFAVCIVLTLCYLLRFGGHFSLRGLVVLSLVVIGLSLAIEIFREQKDKGLAEGAFEILWAFLAQQGVTAGVVQVVLEDFGMYVRHAVGYALRQFQAPFVAQPDVPPGWFLANDISMDLQPEAFRLGFGTGSSYLAELLLFGGWPGVAVGSLVIGWVLGSLARWRQGVSGAVAFWLIVAIVYYPRTMLHDVFHNLLRYGPPLLLLVGVAHVLRVVARRGPKAQR